MVGGDNLNHDDDEDGGDGDDGDDDGDAAKTHFLGGDNLNNVALRTFCLIALPFSSLC